MEADSVDACVPVASTYPASWKNTARSTRFGNTGLKTATVKKNRASLTQCTQVVLQHVFLLILLYIFFLCKNTIVFGRGDQDNDPQWPGNVGQFGLRAVGLARI